MSFVPKETKHKVKAGYKTLYISEGLIEKIHKIVGGGLGGGFVNSPQCFLLES